MALDADTLDQLLDTIDRFVERRLRPLESQVGEADTIPDDLIEEMKEMGLFGLTIPEAYGGLGLNMSEEIAVARIFGHTSPAFRSVFGTNVGIGSQSLVIDGSEVQKQAYLPKMATGEIIGSFCLTEPEAGSDAASVRTTAVKEGDNYIINGTKRFITNAPKADLFSVFARTNPNEAGSRGVSAFLIEAGINGIELGKPYRKMGQQGTYVCDVMFDSVIVPAKNLIGDKEGAGFRTAMKVLDKGRLHISALSVGIAERLIADSLKYALERKQFGQPIAEFQLIQAMLADSQTENYAASCMIKDAAKRRDAGENVAALAASCKLFATEMVGRVADRAVQIHGGAGYVEDYGIERFYRDVRLFRIYEGTSQIQQTVIARDMIRNAS
ncbi:MAG TPA: acyl-CoA dehydrogenase family protein [Pseudomonadales bacterium]|jgi:acyl-CoA dehydrogenase|nr:acyl-CoA dehydrogenase [Gammaproteobacteria bacterium]MDP6027022.1 acyl-CoA dehydrogenase family protein [Pseudomonadales bacterium]MDP6317647.1 acyl-CoA dehydrogenase family protein [Pseudomonadales bacterium]MDP7577373.1 acyl-CoA dehydrogenase family protein [Pseudomonadales bacterium]HJL61790.1 acyl-CoA dehydrogenase family protein [Pseudomonadales bacterium]|tara:strand:+ start:2403 stop:3554 length:1152 start_codon:yes stop_codon:yes gene_type:complete